MASRISKKKLPEQQQAELAQRIRGLKPPPLPPEGREGLYTKPILARSWEVRTKRRVFLICQCEMPPNAAKFVEAFIRVYGADKLPYFWVSGVTRDRPNTLFRERFGRGSSEVVVPTPEEIGLVGYCKKEEQRRTYLLKAEQLELEMKFGSMYDPAWDTHDDATKLERRGRMDTQQEKRARELVKYLADAGINHGLLAVQGAVVMRGPGAPYSETPMVSFDVNDLQNAVTLGLLVKAKVTGSYEWEWYVVTKKT